ncbi:MAG: TM2 domain-containing protein [Candidatus Tumulicola sp.]
MTPYAQMLAVGMRPEAQPTFAYEYQRYAKDPTLAFVLTLVLGVVGGESYYLGNYVRGILMSLALFTGVGLFVTVPMWICRCFTVQNECDAYNDCVAYSLALRYWPYEARNDAHPPEPPQAPQPSRFRPNIGGLPMTTRPS